MYNLYYHFIQKVKQEQIQKYNQKHRAYLIRSGKLKQNSYHNNYTKRNNQNRNVNNKMQENDNEFMQRTTTQNISVKKQQSKPRRQRQFNKNPRKTQNQEPQLDQISSSSQPYNAGKEIFANDQKYQSFNEQQYQNKVIVQNKGFVSDERPLKQNKLSQQQLQYLQQTQNKGDIQFKQQQQPKITPKIQTQSQRQKPLSKMTEKPKELPQVYEFKENQLAECETCGRRFRQEVLAKHEKNCQKVFVEKRKPFEVKKTDQQALLLKIKSDKQNPDESQANKKANWKKQSEKFRNMLKAGRGEKVEASQDDRIQCPGCGRKFNQKAATNHISFCTKKKKK